MAMQQKITKTPCIHSLPPLGAFGKRSNSLGAEKQVCHHADQNDEDNEKVSCHL